MKKSASTPNQTSPNKGQTKRSAGFVVTQLSVGRASKKPAKTHEADSDFDFAQLKASIEELPSMNATKVVALHRQIMNGDYKIQPHRISSMLIDFESSLDCS